MKQFSSSDLCQYIATDFTKNKMIYVRQSFLLFCLFFVLIVVKLLSNWTFQLIIFQFNLYFNFPLETSDLPLQNSSKQTEQVVQYKGYYYRKYIGRAYHSIWICIKSPCSGRIRISELKGGSVTLTHKHDKCDTFPQWIEFASIQSDLIRSNEPANHWDPRTSIIFWGSCPKQ